MTESLGKVASSSAGSSDDCSSPSFADTAAYSSHTTDSSELSSLDAANDIKEAEDLIDASSGGRALDDAKLEDVVNSNHLDPFAHYECAFGFEADLSEPVHVPRNKGVLCAIITEEVLAVIKIQGGLRSYSREISGGNHEFSHDFLKSETQATAVAVGQLDNIKQHLKAVLNEISEAGNDHHDVHDDLRAAYGHAVPWIRRYRQIAIHSHVFYKVNYVLSTTH